MSRKAKRRPLPPPPKTIQSKTPDLPQHQHPAPYSRLRELGQDDPKEVYDAVAAELREGDVAAAAATLLQMTLDETYYDYNDPDFSDDYDVRSYTRLHALRTLERMGEAARVGIEPLAPLLDEEDDWLREEMPFYYAAMGEPAIEPLARRLMDQDAEFSMRVGAGESLAEMAERRPELRDRIVRLLEQALMQEDEEPEVAGFLVCNLLDVGARESLPLIEQAFQEERVDETIVQMFDVEEHFGLPRVSPRKLWAGTEREQVLPLPNRKPEPPSQTEGASQATEEDVSEPYVAPLKVGRNEPCPCGSGKKYKKCCGA